MITGNCGEEPRHFVFCFSTAMRAGIREENGSSKHDDHGDHGQFCRFWEIKTGHIGKELYFRSATIICVFLFFNVHKSLSSPPAAFIYTCARRRL